MDGTTAFVETCDRLFREENLDIARAFRLAVTPAGLSVETLERYKARMLAWSHSQVGLVRGRRARLKTELGSLGSRAKVAVPACSRGSTRRSPLRPRS